MHRLLVVSFMFAAPISTALAQSEYPSRPLRMVVPFAPGGAGDFVARAIQGRLSESLGQQVVVDNRPGASGNIGVEIAGFAPADGYTLLLGNIGAMAINPILYPNTKIKPLRDFRAITQIVDVPGALVVHPSLPAKSASQLVALAKQKPGSLNFGSTGGGSANRLEMEFFMLQTGVKLMHVPYKGGAGRAILGLLSNEVDVMFVTFSSAVAHVKADRLRMLSVVAPERVPALREVATMKEQGFPQFVSGSWQGIYVPRDVPDEIERKLFNNVTGTMKDRDVLDAMGRAGVSVVLSESPSAFRTFWLREHERFAKIVKAANINAE